ncbi:hypothetical protein [Legionella quateirensis]|uniref:Dot/Icm T4SS effector n=1 Tax=Legionella quateirensis TaxID=45072 RepID=A0A378KS14_9GAMM|nr:hypothetical protein [Legionella quateirensis]STY17362.1 Dot/Icm T4SS effector [Legionella quateirensis]
MFTVENSAQGNCMYEAYSISLMYFLRSKNNPQITEAVFNKFGLTDAEKNKLIPLITENRDQKLSEKSIRKIIEPVLATKARALGARQTREDFINRPRTTGLFASAKYGLEFYFRISLRAHPESQFLSSDFTDADYTDAEIYKVANIKTRMLQFARDKSEEVHAKFESEWAKIKATTKPKDVEFRKEMILDQIMAEKTIEFFTSNNYLNLDAYIDRLATNYVWGTEETLLTINRAVQGEHFVRNDRDEVDTYYDTVINLQIRVNGASPTYEYTEQPDLILNNSVNVHWNSLIPEYIFDPVHQVQINADEQKARELQDLYNAEKKRIQAEITALQQNALDRKIAEEIEADDLAVADMIKLMFEKDQQLAEQLQVEEIVAKEELDLATQQDAALAQQIFDEEQQISAQQDLTTEQDAALAQQIFDKEQQSSVQLDLATQKDAVLAQQIFDEEQQNSYQMDPVIQQDADLAQLISDEEQRNSEQMDPVIQQDVDLDQRISDEEQQNSDQLAPVTQQDADLAQLISDEEQRNSEQMDPVIQQDVDLDQRISDEEQQNSDQLAPVTQQDADLAQRILEEEQQNSVQLALETQKDADLALQLALEEVTPADQLVQTANQFTEPSSPVTKPIRQNNPSLSGNNATNSSHLAANKKFESLLNEFGTKIADLDARAINATNARNDTEAASLRRAHAVAQILLEDLVIAKSAYDARPTRENYKEFKNQCFDRIEKSRPVLEQHRGLKQLLGNIVLAVIGLGVVYLAAAVINKAITGNFMFFKTESAKIVDKIKNNVDELEPIQPIPVK